MLTVQNPIGDLLQDYAATWHDVMRPMLNGAFNIAMYRNSFYTRKATNFCHIPKKNKNENVYK